ncbi:DUF305 domain-containing protein [Rhizobium sp.]|jgi:uncharacterized protein (DUF305 family)|uniref:CopM family metallochaperone n=1 Tax=Rhizobium sp. TaxID=391 RepID=UPI000E89B794|nr:DUF305 domain-containing protein [Rhizobium sp.]
MMKNAMLIASLLLATTSAQADDKMPGMQHDMPMSSGASAAFMAANAKMHKAMSAKMTGNADVDFVRGMIGHHQGAIDMAKVELQYGKDEQIRKLAKDIITAQEGEITMMKAWLKAHGQE